MELLSSFKLEVLSCKRPLAELSLQCNHEHPDGTCMQSRTTFAYQKLCTIQHLSKPVLYDVIVLNKANAIINLFQ